MLTAGPIRYRGIKHYGGFYNRGLVMPQLHRPNLYSGDAIVYLGERNMTGTDHHRWQRVLTGSWELTSVPGDHHTVLRDSLRPDAGRRPSRKNPPRREHRSATTLPAATTAQSETVARSADYQQRFERFSTRMFLAAWQRHNRVARTLCGSDSDPRAGVSACPINHLLDRCTPDEPLDGARGAVEAAVRVLGYHSVYDREAGLDDLTQTPSTSRPYLFRAHLGS